MHDNLVAHSPSTHSRTTNLCVFYTTTANRNYEKHVVRGRISGQLAGKCCKCGKCCEATWYWQSIIMRYVAIISVSITAERQPAKVVLISVIRSPSLSPLWVPLINWWCSESGLRCDGDKLSSLGNWLPCTHTFTHTNTQTHTRTQMQLYLSLSCGPTHNQSQIRKTRTEITRATCSLYMPPRRSCNKSTSSHHCLDTL